MSKLKVTLLLIYTSLLLIVSCKDVSNKDGYINQSTNVEIAAEFINAFYSFNRESLHSTLTYAKDSQHSILYYQKWAECGKYKVIKRNDFIKKK